MTLRLATLSNHVKYFSLVLNISEKEKKKSWIQQPSLTANIFWSSNDLRAFLIGNPAKTVGGYFKYYNRKKQKDKKVSGNQVQIQ